MAAAESMCKVVKVTTEKVRLLGVRGGDWRTKKESRLGRVREHVPL